MKWREYHNVTDITSCLFDSVSMGYTVTGMDILLSKRIVRVFILTFDI